MFTEILGKFFCRTKRGKFVMNCPLVVGFLVFDKDGDTLSIGPASAPQFRFVYRKK